MLEAFSKSGSNSLDEQADADGYNKTDYVMPVIDPTSGKVL